MYLPQNLEFLASKVERELSVNADRKWGYWRVIQSIGKWGKG
jgi:hypothetical protein